MNRKKSRHGALPSVRLLFLCASLAGCMPADEALFTEGERQLEQGAFADAYATFTRYLALYRGTVPVYYDRALAARGLGRSTEALEDLGRVIHDEPWDHEARWIRCQVLLERRKMLQEASDRSDPALRPMVQGLMTTDALLMLDDLERLLAANTRDIATRSARASLLWNLGRLPEARADLDTIVLQSPDDVWARNARGMLLHDLGEYAAALEDYDAAIDACDTCTYIVYNKGLSLMAGGRLHEAVRVFRGILATDSLDGETWLMLAECNHDLGRQEEACAALRRSIALHVPEARERYDSLCQ